MDEYLTGTGFGWNPFGQGWAMLDPEPGLEGVVVT
jgi:hypothetical protein